ncbi:MAG: multidrug efflux RND transporter permease subunit [Kiloniellales bacterium]|nr:multidrug efflux RND transporter permease subunit [Kiloniellales bacterium]
MLSRFFIDRPKFALVLSILIVLAGLLSIVGMPIAQFPPITPPVVQIQASYPGANAEIVETTVTTPIEEEVNGVDDMIYMSSTSANNGSMSIRVTFEVGTDPDIAQVNVQNRVALAEPRLPEEVSRQGISVRKQSTNILMFIQLISPEESYDGVFLVNFARINLRDRLLRLPGVGEVELFGGAPYSMRIWLDADRMTSLGITTADVAAAVREQNIQVAAGQIGQMPIAEDQQFTYTLETKGRLIEVAEFEDIIVRANPDGSFVRIREIARVELGAQEYADFADLDGVPSAVLAIYQQPGANALETARQAAEVVAAAAERFPKDIEYAIVYDTTRFVRASILEVLQTLAIAVFLVIVVVYVFLQDWRSTLVPMATIPVSLIGAIAVLNALGFSINTITLFGLILAIGIVVDDAIVVIENVQRLIAEGRPAREATIESMRQVTGPIIATTLVLLAVFVPVAFLPGITGQLYQQFAVTLSAAVVLSSVNALTLSPALCAALLRAREGEPWFLLRGFNRVFDVVSGGYGRSVGVLVRRVAIVLLLFAGLMGLTYFGFVSLPTAFLPEEDQGYFFVDIRLPDGAALPRTEGVLAEVGEILSSAEGVDHVVLVGGFSLIAGANATNSGLAVAVLAPWPEREARGLTLETILGGVQGRFFALQEANVFAFNPPAIPGLGSTGGFEFQLQDTVGRSPQDLAAAMRGLVFAANQRPELRGVFSTFQAEVPRIFVNIDRQKAKTLGVPLDQIFATLQTQLGSLYVNDFNKFGRVYQVRLQAEQRFRDDPEDIDHFYLRSAEGEVIPMETLVTTESRIGPETVSHYNLFRSALVNGSAAPGQSSGNAIAAMEAVAAETLPAGMTYEWTGASLQEILAGDLAPIIFSLAILFVYLFLVAQYESWSVPLAVIFSVPVAAFGAVVAQHAFGQNNDIYGQIGLVLLIALASKNAILIVEFAMQERAAGRGIREAAQTAARLRFRAVMMTAFSFILGVVPLVVASGAGAASRHSLGTPVFGGMIAAAVLGTLLVPVLYVAVQSLTESVSRRFRRG